MTYQSDEVAAPSTEGDATPEDSSNEGDTNDSNESKE